MHNLKRLVGIVLTLVHEDMVGQAHLLVEAFATLLARMGPHAAVGEAETTAFCYQTTTYPNCQLIW